MNAGYDVMRLAWLLRNLPVELVGRLRNLPVKLVGRLRSDRVLRLPKPPRIYAPEAGRPGTARSSAWPAPPRGRSRRWSR
ncbi:hypothetical protein [Streptomyces monomycini]|uniref:hypothetical protein n=1 Tax=Streptomyces monomycini TaxID=371720 RepID=UPI001EECB959|nr:hypothetical protein [Streptomyces monomycini]